jgi:hypothetical protein
MCRTVVAFAGHPGESPTTISGREGAAWGNGWEGDMKVGSTRAWFVAAMIGALLGAQVLVGATPAIAATAAEVTDAGCNTNSIPANDDGSTGSVALPFAADFFGTTYLGLFVNNNGNVTFSGPQSEFTPFTISADTPPIIAPFFADVDTRGAGSSLVTYGTTTFGTRTAFCVNWNDVGYFSEHTDKLNRFQLLLVDRSDVGIGDFDIIMNYGGINWETGDASGGANGFGGVSAGAGFSAGDQNPNHFFQFPGSLVNGGLLDTNAATGLVSSSRGTLTQGRYIFPVRNGLAPGSASISGTVRDNAGNGVGGSPVQACPAGGGSCVIGVSGPDGHYSIVGLNTGATDLTANPPAGSQLLPGHAGPITVTANAALTQDFVLQGPTGPPAGTTITQRSTSGTVPVVYWGDPLTLTTTACAGASVSYQLTVGGTVVRSGPLSETTSGHYQAVIAPLEPIHGDGQIQIVAHCPDGSSETIEFNIYIDPSGTVVDTGGHPVAGATVTLLRADTAAGPFVPVPDGDAIMSPANRTNPMPSGADGSYGWDVLAGFYEIQASRSGCHAPGSTATTVTSDVHEVPPPAGDITLVLDCPASTTTPTLQWPTPASIVFGTPLGATQLDATASVPGTFAYTVHEDGSAADGAVLHGGSHQLDVTFTPTDTVHFTTATANVTILVTAAPQTIDFGAIPADRLAQPTFSVADLAHASSGLPVTFSATGSCTVTGDGAVTATGSGACTITASQAGNGDWQPAAAVSQTVTLGAPTCAASPTLDVSVTADHHAVNRLRSPSFSTSAGNELVVASISADGPSMGTQKVSSVSGGGLTWTRAARSNRSGFGTTEVWFAYATAPLTNVRVKARLAETPFGGTITVTAYRGAADHLGAVATGGRASGAPSVSLTPTACGSLVWAAGHDWTRITNIIPAAGQTIFHRFNDTRSNDVYWVQQVSAPTDGTTPVVVGDGNLGQDRWSLAAVEILPAG